MIPGRIPFFEFDADPRAVLEPTHEGLNLQLPKKCVFAFLGDAVDAYAARVQARTASHFISAIKHYPIHVVRHGGEDIALCRASVGAAPVAQLLDWLIGHARRALRDEGTSYPYAPPTRYVDVSERARRAIRETMRAHGPTVPRGADLVHRRVLSRNQGQGRSPETRGLCPRGDGMRGARHLCRLHGSRLGNDPLHC